MKLKIFDVVELQNGNKATILDNNNNTYKAEIVDSEGINKGVENITEINIRKIIISK